MVGDSKLPSRCLGLINDRNNDVIVSPLSAYELRFKATKGLLPGGDILAAGITAAAANAGFGILPLSIEHALVAGALHVVRQSGWAPFATRGKPILWILHLSYAWIPAGFLLMALGALPPRFWARALAASLARKCLHATRR